MYCKHCNSYVGSNEKTHYCSKKGLLKVDEDDSFLVSALIGYATDSAIVGGLLGGDFLGSVLGDVLDGDLFD
jgi:hypothetical protein